MIRMEMLLLVLFISSLGSIQQAASQDVEIRGPSVVEVGQADLDGSSVSSGGGQSRTVYGQRHLSPHRMMHFGKKAEERLAPMIYSSWPSPPAVASFYAPAQLITDPAAPASVFMGPYRPRQQRSRTRSLMLPATIGNSYLPFEFSLQLEKGQILQAVPEDTMAQAQASSYQLPTANKKLIYDYSESLPDSSSNNNNQLQQLTSGAINEDATANYNKRMQQFSGQRSSKLQDNNEESNKSDEVSNGADSAAQQDNNNQHEILYGSQSPSMPNFGAYNKKAEPKENHFFMHFGRK